MIKIHRVQAFARAHDIPWENIDQELSQGQQSYLAGGGDFWDMASKLGFGNPNIMRDRLAIEQRMAQVRGEI